MSRYSISNIIKIYTSPSNDVKSSYGRLYNAYIVPHIVKKESKVSRTCSLFLSIVHPLEIIQSIKRPIKIIFCTLSGNRSISEYGVRVSRGSISLVKIFGVKIVLLFVQLFAPNKAVFWIQTLRTSYCTYKVMLLPSNKWIDDRVDWRQKIIDSLTAPFARGVASSLSKECTAERVKDISSRCFGENSKIDQFLRQQIHGPKFMKNIAENFGKKEFGNLYSLISFYTVLQEFVWFDRRLTLDVKALQAQKA